MELVLLGHLDVSALLLELEYAVELVITHAGRCFKQDGKVKPGDTLAGLKIRLGVSRHYDKIRFEVTYVVKLGHSGETAFCKSLDFGRSTNDDTHDRKPIGECVCDAKEVLGSPT